VKSPKSSPEDASAGDVGGAQGSDKKSASTDAKGKGEGPGGKGEEGGEGEGLTEASATEWEQEPNAAPNVEVVVVGDVHGQLHDVLNLLKLIGDPGPQRFCVFNGDYVDRGAWGVETYLYLLAWKVLPPLPSPCHHLLDRIVAYSSLTGALLPFQTLPGCTSVSFSSTGSCALHRALSVCTRFTPVLSAPRLPP